MNKVCVRYVFDAMVFKRYLAAFFLCLSLLSTNISAADAPPATSQKPTESPAAAKSNPTASFPDGKPAEASTAQKPAEGTAAQKPVEGSTAPQQKPAGEAQAAQPPKSSDDKSKGDDKSKAEGTKIPDAGALPTYLERPVRVNVSFLVDEIAKVNEALGTFEATVDIQLQWKDPTAAFDPKVEGTFRKKYCLEKATAVLAKIWNPEIFITNIVGDKPIKLKQCVFIKQDGTVIYMQRVKSIFETRYDLKSFPFDTQYLSVKLQSERYNDTEVQFVQGQEQLNESGVREGVTFPGWVVGGVKYSFPVIRSLDGTNLSRFEAKIVIEREPINYLFSFAPLLLIIFIPTIITLYSPKADMGARLGTWTGAILALIALSFTLNLRYPALGPDSIVAQLIAIIFSYEFLMIFLSMTILEKVKDPNAKKPYLVKEIVSFMRWGIPLGLGIYILVRILLTMFS